VEKLRRFLTARGTPIQQMSSSSTPARFVGEQDGLSEKRFKEAIIPILKQHREVLRAYLARVRYASQQGVNVALCVRSGSREVDPEAIGSIGDVFHQMFNRAEHLDIIPVSAEEEPQLMGACRPFYIRDLPDGGKLSQST
jgi:hypothetical protein